MSDASQSEIDVELRIHGVSGTPPELMLGVRNVVQIAGDLRGRFYRPSDSLGQEMRLNRNHLVEGYHWGQFTAGSWRQGLWLLLIPFGFLNASVFMLPDPRLAPRKTRWAHSACASAIRVLGIVQTGILAMAISALLIGHVKPWAQEQAWLASLPDGVLAGLAPALGALTIFGIAYMGRASSFSPENPHSESLAQNLDINGNSGAPPSRSTGLCDPEFYMGDPAAPALRALHEAAGFSTVALVAAASVKETGIGLGSTHLWIIAIAVLGLCVASVTLLGDPEGVMVGHTQKRPEMWRNLARVLKWWAVTLVLWSVAAAVAAEVASANASSISTGDVAPEVGPADYETLGSGLVAIVCAAAIVMLFTNFVVSMATRRTRKALPKEFRPFVAGMAPTGSALIGLFMGVGLSAALVQSVADLIDKPTESQLLYRVSYAWGIFLLGFATFSVFVIIWLLINYRVLQRPKDDMTDRVRGSFERLLNDDEPQVGRTLPRRVRQNGRWKEDGEWQDSYARVALASKIATFKGVMALGMCAGAAVGLCLVIVMAIEILRQTDLPWLIGELSEQNPKNLGEPPPPASSGENPGESSTLPADVGVFALTAVAAALFLLGRRALTRRDQRRGVNVIWDVLSFWPHSGHPFVPPPYSQLAIPQLARRISYYLRSSDITNGQGVRSLIISGHSQGSLIALATTLWLSEAELRRVSMLTHGSQLQTAFARAFPAYVNFDLICAVHAKLDGRWINLYRHTDPFAGPVLSWARDDAPSSCRFSARHMNCGARGADFYEKSTGRRVSGDDWRILDPVPTDYERMLIPFRDMFRHSDYASTEDWQAAVETLLRRTADDDMP